MKVNMISDRIGSGNKLNAYLEPFNRSTHDLGHIWRSSMASGTLVPFMVQVGLPGDTWDIDIESVVKTLPTLGPLMGSYKCQYDIFECPVRQYHSALMQNRVGLGLNMNTVLLPQISNTISVSTIANIFANPDNTQINSSALLSYLGIRGFGINTISGTPTRVLSGLPLLMYWDIFYNYYSNKQETNAYYLGPQTATSNTITNVSVAGTTLAQGSIVIPGVQILGSSTSFVITFSGTAPTLSQIIFYTDTGIVKASDFGSWTTNATTHTIVAGSFPIGGFIQGWNYIPSNTAIQLNSFPLTNIQDMRQTIMSTNPVNTRVTITSASPAPYGPSVDLTKTVSSQNGLALKTYQSDIFNNWLSDGNFANITSTSQVSTAGDILQISALILGKKVYDYMVRVAMSDATYTSWIMGAYDEKPMEILNTPVYHGGLSKELIFEEVVSMVNSGNNPLGTLGGKGTMSSKHKGGKVRIKLNEVSYIIGIVSITPRLDYSQGNYWHTGISDMNQLHVPSLDGIGFQSLITEQMAWWDTQWNGASWVQNSAGKQTAWLNYQTEYNKTFGNFAIQTSEMYMTLNRRYNMNSSTGRIQDLTTYIDPSHYNFIFAYTNLDAQNFWMQIALDIKCRRKMSAKIIPNL